MYDQDNNEILKLMFYSAGMEEYPEIHLYSKDSDTTDQWHSTLTPTGLRIEGTSMWNEQFIANLSAQGGLYFYKNGALTKQYPAA